MDGKYTVNEVEERSSVPATTLRQWERRYSFPKPERSSCGYRLYSERDLEQIHAMKRHIEDGVPASRAAELVRRAGVTPKGARSLDKVTQELFEALTALDDVRADQVLSGAHTLHPVETVLFEIIQPAMVMVGQGWHDGVLDISTEHFASAYIQGRLRALFNLASNAPNAPKVIVACAPKDQHELGALALAIVLRRSGYRVYYLGANTPVADLVDIVKRVKAAAVMISAAAPDSDAALKKEQATFQDIPALVIFGGNLFERQPELAKELGGNFWGNDVGNVIKHLDLALAGVKH